MAGKSVTPQVDTSAINLLRIGAFNLRALALELPMDDEARNVLDACALTLEKMAAHRTV